MASKRPRPFDAFSKSRPPVVVLAERSCDQCGEPTADGSPGEPGSGYEGSWFCIGCWQSWVGAPSAGGSRGPVLGEPDEAPRRVNFRQQKFSWVKGDRRQQQERHAEQQEPHDQQQRHHQHDQVRAAPDDVDGLLGASRQAFEVTAMRCPVYEEPDIGSKRLCVKSRGGRVWGAELTVDGWLKLHGERGWTLTDMRGINDIEEALKPVSEEGLHLAIDGYHSQGICCLEVCFVQVAVRQAPSRDAATLSLRYQGELVFARSQSFGGWVRLAGEPGWMLTSTEEYGQLLVPLYNLAPLDLWALRDAWSSVRQVNKEYPSAVALALRSVESRAQMSAAESLQGLFFDEAEGRWKDAGGGPDLVGQGLLTEGEVSLREPALFRHFFAAALEIELREEPGLRGMLPDELEHCLRPARLPVQAGDDDVPIDEGPLGPTMLFEHKGTVYLAAAGGMLLDPQTEQLVGIWNSTTKEVDPPPEDFDPSGGLTTIEHDGVEYVMTGDGSVFDPATTERLGVYDPDTQSVLLAEPAAGVRLKMAWDGPLEHEAEEEEGGADFQELLAGADAKAARRLFRSAAREYGKALRSCQSSSCVDLDEEIAVLRKRATCYEQLEDHELLLEDAERILQLDAADPKALEWRRLALEEINKAKPGRR